MVSLAGSRHQRRKKSHHQSLNPPWPVVERRRRSLPIKSYFLLNHTFFFAYIAPKFELVNPSILSGRFIQNKRMRATREWCEPHAETAQRLHGKDIATLDLWVSFLDASYSIGWSRKLTWQGVEKTEDWEEEEARKRMDMGYIPPMRTSPSYVNDLDLIGFMESQLLPESVNVWNTRYVEETSGKLCISASVFRRRSISATRPSYLHMQLLISNVTEKSDANSLFKIDPTKEVRGNEMLLKKRNQIAADHV